MKSKGLPFPDNFMDIFGYHREENSMRVIGDIPEDYKVEEMLKDIAEDNLDDIFDEDEEDPDWEETVMDSMYPEGYDPDVDGSLGDD
jgi:hypothetical protein